MIENQLARLTAQGNGCEPRMPPGGIPELTAEDVAMCAAQIKNPNAYNAIMAKYCDCKISMDKIKRHCLDYSWILWLQQGNKSPTSTDTHKHIARVSVEDFIKPEQANRRGDAGRAKLCDMSRSTWINKYSAHYKAVTAYLYNLESEGVAEIKRAMR